MLHHKKTSNIKNNFNSCSKISRFVHIFIWWNKVCSLHFILFYFIFQLYNIWFINYDLLHSYLYILFHLVSIVRKEETWIYILEKNIVINKVYRVRTWSNSSHNAIFFFYKKIIALYFHTYLTIYNTQLQNKFNLLVVTPQKNF